ncbi:methyltransferase family protein [Undibacterium sp. Xuan67W]|uniref:methyltransferase family protein n=1 Tax=Undibacterium sp. Xuan67W TaxID=3413057 RepID=UPI003BF3F26D
MAEGERKGRLFIDGFASLISGQSMTSQQNQVYLSVALKFFFVPFIVNASIAHLSQVNYKIVDAFIYYGMDIYERPFFYKDVFDLAFKLIFAVIFTIDVLPFLFGHLIDSDKVDNKIKSVEYTVAGWFFCLICYPPFNTAFGSFLPSVIPETIQPFKELPNLHYVLTGVAAVLLALYASASVSLGFKGSNLTSRGVVSSGLYGVIRHPAYICKNAAWWVFSLSWAYQQHEAHQPYLFNLLCFTVWSWIYYTRAITEERHMSESDPEYQSYCSMVTYRFIPKII